MSAWIVSKAHIDAMVSTAIRVGLVVDFNGQTTVVTNDNADTVGRMLVDECVASVSDRYPGDDVQAGELPGPIDPYYLRPYAHQEFRELTPVEIHSLARCYGYQSCEHPGWESSWAHAFCDALENHGSEDLYAGCAPWGFEEEHRDAPVPTP